MQLFCTNGNRKWLLCTALHCTAQHCTALFCTALHCNALHCTALHCTVALYASFCVGASISIGREIWCLPYAGFFFTLPLWGNYQLYDCLNDILSVLGLNSGYTVKYTPSPSGVPWASPLGTPSCKGVYLTEYLSFRPNTDTVFPTWLAQTCHEILMNIAQYNWVIQIQYCTGVHFHTSRCTAVRNWGREISSWAALGAGMFVSWPLVKPRIHWNTDQTGNGLHCWLRQDSTEMLIRTVRGLQHGLT